MKTGDMVGLRSSDGRRTETFEIVGVYEDLRSDPPQWVAPSELVANQVYAPVAAVSALGSGTKPSDAAFKIGSPEQAEHLHAEAARVLGGDGFRFDVNDKAFRDQVLPLRRVGASAGSLLWLIALFGTVILGLIVLPTIKERRDELGMLPAPGEKKWKLVAQQAVETVAVAALAIGLSSLFAQSLTHLAGDTLLRDEAAAQRKINAWQPPTPAPRDFRRASTRTTSRSRAPTRSTRSPYGLTRRTSRPSPASGWASACWPRRSPPGPPCASTRAPSSRRASKRRERDPRTPTVLDQPHLPGPAPPNDRAPPDRPVLRTGHLLHGPGPLGQRQDHPPQPGERPGQPYPGERSASAARTSPDSAWATTATGTRPPSSSSTTCSRTCRPCATSPPPWKSPAPPTGRRKTRALDLLAQVGLDTDMAHRNVLKLSGGQQQRVAITRALACDVDILFADEPTGNLDEDTADGIIDIFRRLAHEQNKCVIVVTHSQTLAAGSDRTLTLRRGRVTTMATTTRKP